MSSVSDLPMCEKAQRALSPQWIHIMMLFQPQRPNQMIPMATGAYRVQTVLECALLKVISITVSCSSRQV